MPDITLKLADEHEGKSKEEKSKLFDNEVQRFSDWLSRSGDFKSQGPLNNPERALIKTYLIQKYSGKIG